MNVLLDISIGKNYNNASQKARVITENWVSENAYCPHCRNDKLRHLENNRPVSDFICDNCGNIYECKAKQGSIGSKIVDGAYDTMIKRIHDENNADFFFMSYSLNDACVDDLFFVPKYFFTEQIIEKRRPLSQNARRSGWIGCNILLKEIPEEGRVNIIYNRQIKDKDVVCNKVHKIKFISDIPLSSRGWLLDVMNCVNRINSQEFELADIYRFETQLNVLHPQNNHIQEKIRQQLQLLRDKGLIEFLGNGKYKKLVL